MYTHTHTHTYIYIYVFNKPLHIIKKRHNEIFGSLTSLK